MSSPTHHLDLTINGIGENKLNDNVLTLLKVVRPEWTKGENFLSTLCSKVFTGGISNKLYGYYQEGRYNEDVVLIRIYGAGTELMLDRKTECKNIQVLSAAGRAPPLYAVFNNGIAYGYANGCTLDPDSVREETIRKLIAKEMIMMHQVKPEDMEVKSGLWDKLNTFLDITADGYSDPETQKRVDELVKPHSELRKEMEELRSHLEPLGSPVVFCHNDLLLKNIIYNKEKEKVTFIDHEYAMYNYEHFDVGNHFAEYAGVDDVDFSRYPDKTYQLTWLRYYLEEKAKVEGRSAADVTDEEVERYYVIANKFALAAHMFWGFWGLVQTKHSLIDFGFLDYARLKLGEYFARKEEFLAL